MTFAKGNTFGAGRPPGSRNKSTQWFDELGCESSEQVIRTVYDRASRGNLQAAAILLARTWPLQLELPAIDKPADLIRAHAALVAAMSRGELTPSEAAEVSALLNHQRLAFETADLEVRLTALEEKHGLRESERTAVPG